MLPFGVFLRLRGTAGEHGPERRFGWLFRPPIRRITTDLRAARLPITELEHMISLGPLTAPNGWAIFAATLLAGLVVALALIPEAIAFSIIAGVDPKGGAVCQFLDCRVGGNHGRAAGHDFGCHCCTAVLMVTLVERTRAAIPAGRDRSGRADPDRSGASETRLRDALCLKIGDDRLCKRAGDPDFHGAIAGTGPAQRDMADLCAGGARAGHHLPVPAAVPRPSLPAL